MLIRPCRRACSRRSVTHSSNGSARTSTWCTCRIRRGVLQRHVLCRIEVAGRQSGSGVDGTVPVVEVPHRRVQPGRADRQRSGRQHRHGLGPVTPQQVKAVILLANPKRGTEGATLIGPPLSGQGIAGPAPEGFGKLAGKVFDICHPDDAYCNTDGQSTPFLASLGRIIANPPGAVDVSAELASTASPQTPTITGTSTVAQSSWSMSCPRRGPGATRICRRCSGQPRSWPSRCRRSMPLVRRRPPQRRTSPA